MALKSDPKTWTDPRHVLGVDGEMAALEFLLDKGYRILEHRYRVGRWEVDLIAERDGVVVFVEVKTRSGMAFGRPAEAVTSRKQHELIKVARAWEDRSRRRDRAIRFDVVEVLRSRNGGVVVVRHIENAFRPGWR
jgi:putative endonuclease